MVNIFDKEFDVVAYTEEELEDAYKDGFDDAAADPDAWVLCNDNDETFCLGDTVEYAGVILKVCGLGDDCVYDEQGRRIDVNMITKVELDSWTHWKKDLAKVWIEVLSGKKIDLVDVIEKFADRAQRMSND